MTTSERLSTLWIVVLFNMVFADILGFMYPGFLADVMTGRVGGVIITPAFLLLAALFIQLAICMIYLSRSLDVDSNRLTNMIAATLTIIFVIGGGSLTPHYIFFASVEVAALLYIIRLAWKWQPEPGFASTTAPRVDW